VPRDGYHPIRHFVASYLYDEKKGSLPVISKLLQHKNLQTTELYLQAIDPRFRDPMQRLAGNVLNLLSGSGTEEKTCTCSPTHSPSAEGINP
jgi:hypothetical protein